MSESSDSKYETVKGQLWVSNLQREQVKSMYYNYVKSKRNLQYEFYRGEKLVNPLSAMPTECSGLDFSAHLLSNLIEATLKQNLLLLSDYSKENLNKYNSLFIQVSVLYFFCGGGDQNLILIFLKV